ncbi:MAG: DNRLRE domain-containing protein, partial [Anaerolineae bacterium]
QTPIPNIQSRILQNGVSPDSSYDGTTDATITTWSGNSFANLGSLVYLQVGETGDADEFRLLVRFELEGWLPASIQVDEAWLELRAYDSGYDDGPHDAVAHRVIEEWVEGNGWDLFADGRDQGVTWTTARPGVDWATPGGDSDPTELDRVTIAANPDGWYRWDVTEAVRAWVDGTAPNCGLLLEPDNAPWLHHQFRSSEYSDPNLRPRLIVNMVTECIPGDLDCDCNVDILDIMLVATRWQTAEGDPDYDPAYDLDDSGEIDIVDIMLVAVRWGETCTTPTPTPTPTPTATQSPIPNISFCPPYVDSPLYRPRQTQITVGPNDDWMGIIQSAQPGTEILLLDGEYLLDQYAVLVYDDVTIRSASGNRDAVLVRGMGYGVGSEGFMVYGANVTIADLSMTAMRNHAISIKGEQGAQAPHIYNVHLYDIGTQHIKGTPGGIADGVVACSSIGYTPGGVQGDYIDGVDIHQAIDWVIRDNLFYNIWGDGSGCEVDIDCGTYTSGPAILMWNSASGTIVERNVFRDCFRNIAFGLGNGHEGGIIRNNFIYQSTPGDAGIELRDAHNAQVQHNTIILGGDYPGAIEVWNADGHLIRNNLITAPVWNRGNASFTAGGNITDASNDDLVAPGDPHLPPGSRAIGAGVPTDVDSDIDGDPREGRWDVGADQFSP